MIRHRILYLVVSLLAAAGGVSPALAEEEAGSGSVEEAGNGSEFSPLPEPSAVPGLPPPGIEAIEVTGERLDSANVQDEAQAITAFSGADLDKASIVSVDSLQFNVPGLHVGQSGQAPIITLRGIGTENASLTGEPGVAFHVDGINMGRPAAARVAFFDLETLEVKRGPQGLLGGKNSTSGHINLISKKPIDEYEVTGDVLSGNYDRLRLRGSLNVPIGEYAASRIALYHEGRDGYLDNKNLSDSDDPFDVDEFGLRGHLKLHATDSLEWLMSYNYFKQDGSGPQGDIVPIYLDAPCRALSNSGATPPAFTYMPSRAACYETQTHPQLTVPGVVTVPPRGYEGKTPQPVINFVDRDNDGRFDDVNGDGRVTSADRVQTGTFFNAVYAHRPAVEDLDPRSVYADVQSGQQNRYWGWSTHLDWAAPSIPVLGESQVKLLGGFQQTENGFVQDFDGTSARMSGYEYEDVAHQYSAELQWSGASFAENLDWQMSLFYQHEQAARDLEVPNLISNLLNLRINQETNNKAYGAALHGGYQLTDSLRFNLGGRFIKDKKKNYLLRYTPADSTESKFRGCEGNLNTTPPPDRPLDSNPDCSYLDREHMWGAGLEWRPFGDDHLLYTKIDRGAKSGGFRAGQVGEYKPERIWAYVTGTKSQFFDQRLTVNLEGFFYNYQDLQIVVIDGATLRTENTDARMYGWDLEASASPIEGSLISAVVSYLHTETIDYYSLDPANPDQFLLARLAQRENAESLQADNVNVAYEDLLCPNPAGSPPQIRCGDFPGSVNGLDDYSGNTLSRAPEWKFTLTGEYEIPLGRFGAITPRVQYTWQDDAYFRAFNKDFDFQEAYHLTDAKLIWTSPEQRWSAEIFVQNIEDEAAKQNILVGPSFLGSPPLAWYGPPRFYGLQVGFKY
jgi:outer membrane receptor protein involved in Fe transport